MRNPSKPLTKKDVRSFLGLTGYYREFVPNYAAIALPLTDATRKGQSNQVIWNDAQEKAYTTLKAMITSHPILHLPDDHSKPFFLQTDASEIGIGAVLMQQHGGKMFPVTYISKKLTEKEKRFSKIERECLAIVWSVKKLRTFLYGREFVLQTDHQPLTYLKQARFLNDRVMSWALYLQNYHIKTEMVKGMENKADFLSRMG